MTEKIKTSNKSKKNNIPYEYKGYLLKVTQNDNNLSEPFTGKATKGGKEVAAGITGKTKEFVISELKKSIDRMEQIYSEDVNEVRSKNDTLPESKKGEEPIIPQSRPKLSLPDNSSENSDIVNTNKPEIEVSSENNDNKVSKSNEVSSLEKTLNLLIKDVQKINKSLDKPQPIIASQNEILAKISYLTQVINANQSDLEQWRKETTEKLNSQETLLRDILDKLNAVAQTDHVTEHLTHLHNESKNLHIRLDNKIDLQDAEQILSLKTKIEESVNNELIISVSEKIMPVVDILKRKVDGLDTTFSKSVDDLEQRCRQAGLIPIDKLF